MGGINTTPMTLQVTFPSTVIKPICGFQCNSNLHLSIARLISGDMSPATHPKIFAYAKFNLDALLSLATRLRGRSCSADPSIRPKTGSLNWVIFITFDDGIEWAFRSPRNGPSAILTEESASKLLASEASTLKYLRANSSVPVPEVYSFRLAQITPSNVIKYNPRTFVNSSKKREL